MRPTRRGMAIPMAAGFCVLVVILIMATVFVRTETKRQTRASFQSIKAHFLAQGAIQVALLKFRVLPNEGFYASDQAKAGNQAALNRFLADVGTGSIPLQLSPQGTWTNRIAEGQALNAVSEGYDDWVHVVSLRSIAEVNDGFLNAKGQVENRIEEVTKTVEVRKKRD